MARSEMICLSQTGICVRSKLLNYQRITSFHAHLCQMPPTFGGFTMIYQFPAKLEDGSYWATTVLILNMSLWRNAGQGVTLLWSTSILSRSKKRWNRPRNGHINQIYLWIYDSFCSPGMFGRCMVGVFLSLRRLPPNKESLVKLAPTKTTHLRHRGKNNWWIMIVPKEIP